ncbi:MAG: alpha-2-macroglobulin family protein, partial [Bacteroidales bacterium]
MRNIFVLLLSLLVISVTAQTRLSDSRQTSEKTYIYTVSKENLRKIHLNGKPVNENMFGGEVDRYLRGSAVPVLSRGNYMLVTALGNKLEVKEHTVDNLNYRIIPASDFRLFLTDTLGNVIADAKVKHGSRSLDFDRALQVYRCGKLRNNEVVEVDHRGVVHYITVLNPSSTSLFRRIGNKIATFFKTVSREVKSWFVTPNESTESFIVFSKPRYKPGETVRMKAHVTTRRGEPYDEPVQIRLKGVSTPVIDTLITTLSPYRPGMYSCDFLLTDSLNLQLDRDYIICVKNDNQPLVSNSFRYEDYELKGLRFTMQAGKKEYTANDTLRIGFDVRDENGMAVNDGRLSICVLPNHEGREVADTPAFYFIPDTLWSSTCYLDTLIEKKFTIPNSVFPNGVALHFRVNCVYLSPDNESHRQSLQLERKSSPYMLAPVLEKGMLTLSQYHNEMSQTVNCDIRFFTDANAILSTSLQLPGRIAVPWNATHVEVKTSQCERTFTINEVDGIHNDPIVCDFYRRNDSIGLDVDNPAGLPFWYSIRRKGKEIASGYGKHLNYRTVDTGEEGYAMSLNYFFAGNNRQINRELPYLNPNLQMEVVTKQTVMPGQTVPIQVALRDRKGLPVVDADVTAFAYTSKFKAGHLNNIAVPGIFRQATPPTTTWYRERSDMYDTNSAPLSWGRWRDVMALDTIEYYLFLYPDHHYSITENSKNDQTLVAPFVVEEGNVLDVAMLWIDDVLHYANCAEQENPYVFAVTPGVHAFRFRTPQYEVEVDNVLIREGKKNIFSFNVKHADPAYANHPEMPRIRTTEVSRKKKGYFSEEEIRVLTDNMILVNDLGSNIIFPNNWNDLKLPQWLKGGDRFYYIDGIAGKRRYGSVLVGPFPERYAVNGRSDILQMYEMDSLWVNFPLVGGSRYTFYPRYAFAQSSNPMIGSSEIPHAPESDPDFRAMPTDRESIHDNFRKQKLMFAQRGWSIFFTDAKGIRRKFGKAKLDIDLENLEDVDATLVFVEESDGTVSLGYGNKCSFTALLPGETRIAVLCGDSTYFMRTVALQEGGRNVLKLCKADKRPVDDWSRSIFNRFDSLLTVSPLQNPFIASTDSLTIHSAPESLPLKIEKRKKGERVIVEDDGMFEPVMMGSLREDAMPVPSRAPAVKEVAVVYGTATRMANSVTQIKGVSTPTPESEIEPMAENVPEKSIRHDFRDDAFWQPSLRTDSLGMATFEVTYPDDITAWDAFFIGTGNKKQQNMRKLNIRAVLMRSARLSVPRFAIEGDSLMAIGRIINHQGDTVSVERSFTANGKSTSARIEVAKTYLDHIPVVAGEEDSLSVVYQISMPDGSSDGEERKIPVFPKGMLKAEGEFRIINGTEKQVLKLGTLAPATLHAETTPLNVFLEEIARVADYPYDCNEQMASKVKVLLARKSIYSTLGKRSNDDKQIRS